MFLAPALSGSSSRVIRARAQNSQRHRNGDLAPRCIEGKSHAADRQESSLKKCPLQNYHRHREIDNETSDVDERGDERSRSRSGIETTSSQDKRQH